MHPTLIAKHLCDRQPLSVRVRLMKDQAFGERYGLRAQTVVTIDNTMSVDQRDLLVAARRALHEQADQRLVDLNEAEIVVAADQDAIVLRRTGEEADAQGSLFAELAVLSPRPEKRTRALDTLLDQFGPTAPDFSPLRRASEQRELSDDEVSELLAERYKGVAAVQARTAAAFEDNTAGLDELVPDALGYYERFCGPDPGTSEPQEYLSAVLPDYRKGLLHRDLVQGLNICLLGALRDDLMPGAWTGHLSDDELWNALVARDPSSDPVSLLGALDIALYRQHDERYQGFAEDAVKKLVEDAFPRSDGADTYELLPIFAKLVLDRINGLEGGAMRAPFWKRMCAWMQAGLLGRMTLGLKLDLDSLRRWVEAQWTPAVAYAAILDLRREPMYRASILSREPFRDEVIGRLAALRLRHEAAGRTVPRSGDVNGATSAIADRGSPLGWLMPGPLEGQRRPAEANNRNLPTDNVDKLTQELVDDPGGPVWAKLAYLSQCFDLGRELTHRAREAAAQINIDRGEPESLEYVDRLGEACMVAAAHRDVELARAIGSRAVSGASIAGSGDDTVAILQVLLAAGAAFENEREWAEWLEERLFELAARLPAGEPSKVLLRHLGELKKVLNLTMAIHARAEALASAAN